MAYITRNANIVLLLLILISAAALVTATIFFQENFDRINEAYNSKLNQLNQVTENLEEKQASLDRIQSELVLKAAREEEFTQQYTDVREEKDVLKGEKEKLTIVKASLETELADTEASLQSTRNSLEAIKGENELLTVDLAKSEQAVKILKDDKDDLQDDVVSRDAKISCLQSTIDADEGNC